MSDEFMPPPPSGEPVKRAEDASSSSVVNQDATPVYAIPISAAEPAPVADVAKAVSEAEAPLTEPVITHAPPSGEPVVTHDPPSGEPAYVSQTFTPAAPVATPVEAAPVLELSEEETASLAAPVEEAPVVEEVPIEEAPAEVMTVVEAAPVTEAFAEALIAEEAPVVADAKESTLQVNASADAPVEAPVEAPLDDPADTPVGAVVNSAPIDAPPGTPVAVAAIPVATTPIPAEVSFAEAPAETAAMPTPVPMTTVPAPAPQQSAATVAAQNPPAKKNMKPLFIALGALLVIGLGIGGFFGFQEMDRSNSYNAAVNAFETGDYSTASAGFAELGDYKESAFMVGECEQYATYARGIELYEEGDYEAAKEQFAQVKSQSIIDIPRRINECDYAIAEELLEAGNYADAQDAFKELDDYSDSSTRANECGYALAEELVEAGDYQGARSAFASLGSYQDANERRDECDYVLADQYFVSRDYETAYFAFKSLGDYKDSAARMAGCVQPLPATGILYQDSGYYYAYGAIEIVYNYSDSSAFYKIYDGDTIVARLFLNGNSQQRVYLKPGNYIIKEGTGDIWFGEVQAFGEAGWYSTMTFDDSGTDYLTIGDGDLVTLTINSGTAGNVSERDEDLSTF